MFLPKKRARQAQANPPTTSSSNSQPSTSQGIPSVTPTTGPTSAQKCDTRKQHPSKKIPACPDSRPNDIFNYVNLPRDLSDSEIITKLFAIIGNLVLIILSLLTTTLVDVFSIHG